MPVATRGGATTLGVANTQIPRRTWQLWARTLPVVYRWAYDYSVPGADEDFMPQNHPPNQGRRQAKPTRHWASQAAKT